MNPILGRLLIDLLIGVSEIFMLLAKPLMVLSLFSLKLTTVIRSHVH
jgi:hypothetical protein